MGDETRYPIADGRKLDKEELFRKGSLVL